MAHDITANADGLADVVRRLAPKLKSAERRALVEHPQAVLAALTRAARSLEEGEGVEVLGRSEADARAPAAAAAQRVASRTAPAPGGEALLSVDAFAERAGVKSRQTVHNWRRAGKVIAWESAKRSYVLPAAQLDERGRPLAGLAAVSAAFGEAYAAWAWLTAPSRALGGRVPLEVLRAGEADAVAAAAAGTAQGDFA